MGESRHRFGKNYVYVIGFFVCLFLFIISWYKAELWILILVSIIGAAGAVIGETKKFWWLDDDFTIQILPAVLILVLWLIMQAAGVNILPDPVIQPALMPW